MSTLTAPPDSFAAGTTVRYTRSLSDYPASAGWVLTLYLAGAAALAKAATVEGDSHTVTLTATETAGLAAGSYTWVERVAKAGDVFDVGTGVLLVTPNIATAAPGALQSWEEKELAAVEAAISAITAGGMTSYQIAGRMVTKLDLHELQKLRAQLKSALQRQRGGSGGRTWRFAFTGTGNE